MEPIMEATRVSFSYEEEAESPLVLDGISLTVRRGEFLAVLGHNGSGKSTLAKHFNAILLPQQGTGAGGRDGDHRRGQAL